jgi:excisionase family DNA binding protein
VLDLLREIQTAVDELRRRLDGSLKPLLTVEEIAELTGRAPFTVRRWIKQGILSATRTNGSGPRGRLLVSREQVQRLVGLGRGGSIPAAWLGADSRSFPVGGAQRRRSKEARDGNEGGAGLQPGSDHQFPSS